MGSGSGRSFYDVLFVLGWSSEGNNERLDSIIECVGDLERRSHLFSNPSAFTTGESKCSGDVE